MADTIIDGIQLNVNSFSYGALKANPKGGKNAKILNKTTKSWLNISTPLLMTWGAKEDEDLQSHAPKGTYTMSLQFPSEEYGANEDTNSFLKNMKDFEHKVRTDGLVNSFEWFGKKFTNQEVVDALFNPMLKYPKVSKGSQVYDYNKMPSLNVKIPKYENVWKCEIYDENGEILFPKPNSVDTPIELLKPSSMVSCILECGGVWFINGKFSITWSLVQAVVKKPKSSIRGAGQCLIKLKESDKNTLQNQTEPDEQPSNIVDDTEDEDEDEDDVPSATIVITPPPPPQNIVVNSTTDTTITPAPKKTIIRKK